MCTQDLSTLVVCEKPVIAAISKKIVSKYFPQLISVLWLIRWSAVFWMNCDLHRKSRKFYLHYGNINWEIKLSPFDTVVLNSSFWQPKSHLCHNLDCQVKWSAKFLYIYTCASCWSPILFSYHESLLIIEVLLYTTNEFYKCFHQIQYCAWTSLAVKYD